MKGAFVTILTGTSLLAACNVVPDFQQPATEVPTYWRATEADDKTQVNPEWWKAFGSDTLDQLIEKALAYNNDLAAAAQRIEQARAQAKIAGADLWPSVGIAADYSAIHDDLGETSKKSGAFSVAYEVDLWGKNRAKRDAGKSRLFSEIFARDALRLVVMSDVAQTYFSRLAFGERITIANEFLQNVAGVLTIIEARFATGAVSALDVAQQKTELASARANLDLLLQQQNLTENALAILLGQPPQQLALTEEPFAAVQMPGIKPSQPGSLLQRRPDIRQIEMQLKAANADVGVALAAFYPSLQLNLDTLLASPQPAGVALTMAAGLSQPLFQGGRLEGGLENAKARNAELVNTYQQTVLTAFKEVEDAATIRSNSSRRMQALVDAEGNAREAYQLSKERYRVGAIDYQSLLNTQRSLLTAQNNRVQARLDVLVAMVQLYRALGGGWEANF
ncbi:MAG: efflux transporter outer membrane subunit [Gammaproteobacteria bacterium]